MASPDLLNNTIALTVRDPNTYEEGVASETIYPGMLLTLIGIVGVDSFKYSIVSWPTSNITETMFATENIYQGKSITDAYVADELMSMRCALRGEVFLTKIDALPVGPDIFIGQQFRPNTTGWLREYFDVETSYPPPIAVSLEDAPSPVLPRWTAVRIL